MHVTTLCTDLTLSLFWEEGQARAVQAGPELLILFHLSHFGIMGVYQLPWLHLVTSKGSLNPSFHT